MGQLVVPRSLVSNCIPFRLLHSQSINSQNMGQNCIGIERLIVHSKQYDELYEMFSELAKKFRVGSVLTLTQEGYVTTVDGGSMISGDRFRGLEKIIRDATEAGAQVVGGKEYKHGHDQLINGSFFSPTVVGPVDTKMDIAKQERSSTFSYSDCITLIQLLTFL